MHFGFKLLPNSFIFYTQRTFKLEKAMISGSKQDRKVVCQVSCWHKKITIEVLAASARIANNIRFHFHPQLCSVTLNFHSHSKVRTGGEHKFSLYFSINTVHKEL